MRNNFIDIIKGLAIYLVVWGHCLQFCGTIDFLSNPAFIFIYSFHMPLFMGTSGYLFYSGVQKRGLGELVATRIRQLGPPWILWSVVAIPTYLQKPLSVSLYFNNLVLVLWFLPALLISSVVVAVCEKLLKYGWLGVLAFFIMLLPFPDAYGLVFLKFMLPFFALGYYYNMLKLSTQNIDILGGLSLLIFAVMLYFWKVEHYIYTSGMRLTRGNFTHMAPIITYRYLIGLVGSISFIWVLNRIKLPRFASRALITAGRHTLGIYILGVILNPFLNYVNYPMPVLLYSSVYTTMVAVVVAFATEQLSVQIQRVDVLNRLLFGAKVNR
ncbi:acyltransferase family protein [Mucilaginibacter daejeonensis]|uniref:acyltransferase family protein n=1 Tax=Mucilaginibacter daejeonensis TaxID=398049 RepID=UPI001D17974C|nr:acyltransferase family protein [Mucilaginibacter daejeonensis]UEG53297.1 acyltransferase family protein [Mucilaginibacter daejeonensis]